MACKFFFIFQFRRTSTGAASFLKTETKTGSMLLLHCVVTATAGSATARNNHASDAAAAAAAADNIMYCRLGACFTPACSMTIDHAAPNCSGCATSFL